MFALGEGEMVRLLYVHFLCSYAMLTKSLFLNIAIYCLKF